MNSARILSFNEQADNVNVHSIYLRVNEKKSLEYTDLIKDTL